MTTKRLVSLEVHFNGDGHVARSSDGFHFSGGVAHPNFDGLATFQVHREARDDGGLWNPVDGEGPIEAGIQVNLWANSDGYRELARYFLAMAELDTAEDPGYHEHLGPLLSADGHTQLHLICRKSPKANWPT
jgi:hypothetical protein